MKSRASTIKRNAKSRTTKRVLSSKNLRHPKKVWLKRYVEEQAKFIGHRGHTLTESINENVIKESEDKLKHHEEQSKCNASKIVVTNKENDENPIQTPVQIVTKRLSMRELEKMLKNHIHKLVPTEPVYHHWKKRKTFSKKKHSEQNDQYRAINNVQARQSRYKRRQLLNLFRDVYPNTIFTCSQK